MFLLEIFLSFRKDKMQEINRNLLAFLSEFVYEFHLTKEVLHGEQLYILKLQDKSKPAFTHLPKVSLREDCHFKKTS